MDINIEKANDLEKIYPRTVAACESNSIKEIQDMLSLNCYPSLSNREKEINIFIIVNNIFEGKGLGENILRYLIFDYQITDNLPFKQFHAKEVTEMFATRKLKTDLSTELKNSNEANKKLKI